eukprot:UN04651
MTKLTSLICVVIIAFILSAFAMHNVEAQSAGIITSISGTAITNLANQIIPIALQRIRDSPIPDAGEGKVTVSGISISNLEIESFGVGTNNENALIINLSGLYINIWIDKWRYKEKLFSVSGHASLRASLSTVLVLRLNPGGDGRFQLDLPEAVVNLSEFRITLSGNLIAKVLNAVKNIFNGVIKRAAQSAIQPLIRNVLYDAAAQFSQSIPASSNTPYGPISFAPAAFGTRYDGNSISLAFNGNINGNEPQRHGIESSFSPSGALLDVYLDTFVFNSALGSKQWDVYTYNKDHPGDLPVPGWKGKDWVNVLPKLAQQSPDADITIQLRMMESPQVIATAGVLSAKLIVGYDIFTNDIRVATIKGTIVAGASASIQGESPNYIVMLQLQSPTVVYETVESTVGDIDFTLLNAILDFGFNLFTGIVNTVLAAGIAIPTVDRLVITDAAFTIFEGGFRFACGIAFNL